VYHYYQFQKKSNISDDLPII